jgi:hypothetical protein
MKTTSVVAIIGALLLAGCTHSPTAPHYVAGTGLSPYLGAASPTSSVKGAGGQRPALTLVDTHEVNRSVVAR